MLLASCEKYGLSDITLYEREDLIRTEFYEKNKEILDLPQRAGCSLWKIYYLHHEYFKLEEGDILFYADAGSKIINSPQVLINLCKQKDIVLFNINNNPLNRHWCKRDSFVFMDCDEDKYHNGPHYNAAFQLYKKCKKNDLFINEMFKHGQNINIISDCKNISNKSDFNDFVEHRYDQSILSILGVKYNIEQHRYPGQLGNHMKTKEFRVKNEWLGADYVKNPMTNSPYLTIFDHHRNKNKFSDLLKYSWWKKNYFLLKHRVKIFLLK